MTLRRLFLIYIILLHAVFAGAAFWFLREQRTWLIALELYFTVSIGFGLWLLRGLLKPLEVLRSGIDFLKEGDFTTRFRDVRNPELADLIQLYNRMVDHLREERVRSEEHDLFLQKLVRRSPSGVVTLDFEGRVAMANPGACRMLCEKEEELVGKSLSEIDSPLGRKLLGLEQNASELMTLRGRRRVKCQRLSFMDRGFSRDFFLLEEFTAELHQSEKEAYGKLIRLMSHEVNNTTGSVGSLLQSCLNYRDQLRSEDSGDFENAIGVARRRIHNMNDFMKKFADVVRIPPPVRTPSSMDLIIRDAVTLVGGEMRERGIEIDLHIEDNSPAISCDAAQLEQVVLNILKNAYDAIGSNGKIQVRFERGFSKWRLTIEDDGPGISEEIADRIFSSFFTTRSKGQGIGLTVVQDVLLSHGFDYSLENRTEGGAIFTIQF